MYQTRGIGDTVATVSAPATPTPSVQPQFFLSTNKYGETFWDFVDNTSTLDLTGFLDKYRVAIGIGAALLLGSFLLLKKGQS